MKSGAGDDPFAEDVDREETARDDSEDVDESAGAGDHADAHGDGAVRADASESGGIDHGERPSDGGGTVDADGPVRTNTEDPEDADAADPENTDAVDSEDGDGPRDVDIPWVLRRGSVKDDRPNVTQFFLRDETDAAERRFKNEVEDLLDTDVYTLDLREAAYLVAMRHSDEVAQQLRSWGYDYLD
ncbi:hypothetical protein [Halomarina litorea]|uniref:hypothetical protein n=1 Tax=Halomarina litorea TaxID=2961595 RepID=UPI0020C4D2B0|nr:hypothetical protein [Halomarina sp. BCD28]